MAWWRDYKHWTQDSKTGNPRKVDSRTQGPKDARTHGPKDPRTLEPRTQGPKDARTQGPWNPRTRDQRTKDPGIQGPEDPRTWDPEPKDQEPGIKGLRTQGPGTWGLGTHGPGTKDQGPKDPESCQWGLCCTVAVKIQLYRQVVPIGYKPNSELCLVHPELILIYLQWCVFQYSYVPNLHYEEVNRAESSRYKHDLPGEVHVEAAAWQKIIHPEINTKTIFQHTSTG